MVKSILQYLLMLHSPNLHQLFILTWSTNTACWFVSLTYISRLSDGCLYYSTYWCYIHQTCTNYTSWHDLLIPHVGLCPWPTFHAWVTMIGFCLYYSTCTYKCYIHQTYTNCLSWHDLLTTHGILCPWPTCTFHASVTKTQNGNRGAPVIVPITIMSSFCLTCYFGMSFLHILKVIYPRSKYTLGQNLCPGHNWSEYLCCPWPKRV